ncbi:MAG TPA: site-specific integrase [Steroidobacteraceae bacterium]|nr:site-specific integrase [Steroidobacteraceae bacterium]
MSKPIHQANFRNDSKRCPVRTEPYWAAPIVRGQFLGYRKISADAGSWVARIRIEDEHGKLVQRYQALGDCTERFGYDEAQAAAVAWFATVEAGARTDSAVTTVAAACRAYVAELRSAKRDGAADDAERRFERTVYGRDKGSRRRAITPNALAGKSLAKLRATDLKAWRDGSGLGKSASNRTLTALKAALNLARKNKHAPAALAVELEAVTPHKNAGKRRDLYLDIKQRRAALKAAKGALHDLVEGAAHTGARAGELVKAKRRQFDARTKSMTFTGKTGSRTVPLSPNAGKLFTRLSKGKGPDDHLFTRDDGQPWAHSDWDELVRDTATAAKLPAGVCLYTFRHSWITSALLGGLATLDVARLTGTSVMMIEKHYGHLVADAARERLAKVAML